LQRLVAIAKKIALTSPRGVRRLVTRLLGERFLDGLTPEFVWLEATNACPNQCAFCDIGQNKATKDPLSPSEIERMLRDPLFKRLRVIIVSGGEPTIRKDLDQILAAVHRAHPRAYVVLSSSAALPDRLVHAVRSGLEAGMNLEVGVSVDGLAERHDELRGMPGLFEKVDRSLRELAELARLHPKKLHVKVGFVLSDVTVGGMEAVRDYATAQGFEFNVQWYNQGAYYGNVGRDLLSNTAALERATRSLPPTPLNDWGRRVLRGRPLDYRCATLHNSCLVKSNGDVAPCFNYWNQIAGNVRQQSPSEIWKSQRARETRQVVRDCHGCLNSCGVIWSQDANYPARLGFGLRHPGLLLQKLAGRPRPRPAGATAPPAAASD